MNVPNHYFEIKSKILRVAPAGCATKFPLALILTTYR